MLCIVDDKFGEITAKTKLSMTERELDGAEGFKGGHDRRGVAFERAKVVREATYPMLSRLVWEDRVVDLAEQESWVLRSKVCRKLVVDLLPVPVHATEVR